MPTCGTGLAEHAAFPMKLGQWSAALADVLEVHTMSIDLEDPLAGDEVRAYVSLVNRFRELALQLRTTANDAYGQATDRVNQMVDRGREAYDRARTGGAGSSGDEGGGMSGSGSTGNIGSTGNTGSSYENTNPNYSTNRG